MVPQTAASARLRRRSSRADPALDLGRVTVAPPQTGAGLRSPALLARPGRAGASRDLHRHHRLRQDHHSRPTHGRGHGRGLVGPGRRRQRRPTGQRVHRARRRARLPARIWLPGHPDSWTYDLCAGEPTAVGNRLVGAFEHGREGQVYRNLSQALVPLAARALVESGQPCTLDSLRFSLDEAHLAGLARREADVDDQSRIGRDAPGRACIARRCRGWSGVSAPCATASSGRGCCRRTARSTSPSACGHLASRTSACPRRRRRRTWRWSAGC